MTGGRFSDSQLSGGQEPQLDPNVFFQLGYGARGTSVADDINRRVRDGQQPQPQQKTEQNGLKPEDVPAVAPIEKLPPLDPTELKVVDGVLEVKYGSKNFDRILREAQGYDTIRIKDMPQGVELRHWVDGGGNFFWFRNGQDGNARHYFPPALKGIEINGAYQDVGKERLLVADAFAAKHTYGFNSWEKQTSPITYFMKMSQNADGAMAVLEKSLTDAMQTSNNPYYKIYLADVYTAQAVLAIPAVNVILRNAGDLRNPQSIANLNRELSRLQGDGAIQTNNPATINKLNDAIKLLEQVTHDSNESLKPLNRFPPKNVYTPMDPYRIYDDPNNNGYFYGFWGGSLDQARHRQVALTFMRDLVASGALKFELPPVRAPR